MFEECESGEGRWRMKLEALSSVRLVDERG